MINIINDYNEYEKTIYLKSYPDGTKKIDLNIPYFDYYPEYDIVWKFDNEDELASLIYIAEHLKEDHLLGKLYMPYVPNARMDRIKTPYEVFTLKYFAKIINWIGFERVKILDPHSNVTAALFDRCSVEDPQAYIENVIFGLGEDDIVLYYPDEGAAKKYSEILGNFPWCYGKKKRNWSDGKILGLDVITNGVNLKGKRILMVDDIISYGGTVYYGAQELQKLGAEKIYAYATHTENSVLVEGRSKILKAFDEGLIEKIFTTDSIFRGSYNKIQVSNCTGGHIW